MVKIRYSELPAGLHVSAESQGRQTIIYLHPGLTAQQRRAALVRVRSSGRMGRGPRLSTAAMALAMGTDRLRTTVRNGAAATRGHPLLLLPPLILLVSSAIVFVLMSFVTLTVRPHAPVATKQLVAPSNPAVKGQGGTSPGGRPGHRAASPGPGGAGPVGTGSGPTPSARVAPSPSSSGSQSPAPVRSDTPTPSPSTSAASPTPSPSPSPSQSQSSTCLKIGPLGLCLKL